SIWQPITSPRGVSSGRRPRSDVAGARRHRTAAHDADVGEGPLGLLAARNAGGLPPLRRQRTTTSDPSVTARRAPGDRPGPGVGHRASLPAGRGRGDLFTGALDRLPPE